MLDNIERGFAQKNQWSINSAEQIVLTGRQYAEYQYTGNRITDGRRTLMIPGTRGCVLLTEGMHFIVKEG